MEKKSNPNWERISQIIEKYKYQSVSAFARELGLSRGENLYQIKRGNNGISKELAGSICTRFPEISKGWVLTGEGVMISRNPANDPLMRKVVGIPFYENFPMNRPPSEPSKMLYFSKEFVINADFAVSYVTDELFPLFKKNSFLFLRQWALINPIIYGELYFIKTEYCDLYRVIRKTSEAKEFYLECPNREKYDDLTISIDDIKELYLVV